MQANTCNISPLKLIYTKKGLLVFYMNYILKAFNWSSEYIPMQMRYLEENYITITFTAINPPSKQFMSICIQHWKYRGKTHYIPTSIFPLENFLDLNTVIGSNFQSNPS